jgi:hypothetical protein
MKAVIPLRILGNRTWFWLLGCSIAAGLLNLVAVHAQDSPQGSITATVEDTARPIVMLRYNQLEYRAALRFQIHGQGEHTKPVGRLNFEFAPGRFPTDGFPSQFSTYCVEPLRPIYAGREYAFTYTPFGRPSDFQLPDTEAGRQEAAKRLKFVREFYGRFYTETQSDPEIAAPAFQTALWELIQESEFPEGPMPFHLQTGTFQANYPEGVKVPEYVERANAYLRELTGDDSAFTENPELQGLELVRLEDVESINGMIIQAQLALRAISAASHVAALDGASGLGSLGGLGIGGGGIFSSGLVGGSTSPLGGRGLVGAGPAGFAGARAAFQNPLNSPTISNDFLLPPGSPQIGERTPENPPGIKVPPVIPPPIQPPLKPPVDPPEKPPVDPPEPVPAPPGIVLGLLAGGYLWWRRRATVATK